MTDKEIIKELLNIRHWSQSKLAAESGFKSQSNITGMLNNSATGMRVDNFIRLLDSLGCELIVHDKMGSNEIWVVERTVDADKSDTAANGEIKQLTRSDVILKSSDGRTRIKLMSNKEK